MLLTADTLALIATRTRYGLEPYDLIVFGIRGSKAVHPFSYSSAPRRYWTVYPDLINHRIPRCTLGIWRRDTGEIRLYPGSTVPAHRYIARALERGGRGANQLVPGLYMYRRGIHRRGSPTAHGALRHDGPQPVIRTADDFEYTATDRIEIDRPYNNIHAGWCNARTAYDSAGCQVIAGYPDCEARGDKGASGPWADFWAEVDASGQDRFPYILLPHYHLDQASEGTYAPRLRFGSRGPEVEELQARLGLYGGARDGIFGPQTYEAVRGEQRRLELVSDGVVGPRTAGELGVRLA